MDRIDTLIRELENASVSEERGVILDALTYAHASKWIDTATFHRAQKMLHVGAFLSAVLPLVPEGCRWSVGNQDREKAKAHASCLHMAILHRALNDPSPRTEKKSKAVLAMWNNTDATTPALSLTTASFKARRGA